MMSLPLERLMKIATCQARPGVVVGLPGSSTMEVSSVSAPAGEVDTSLAARMVANGLCVALRNEVWQCRALGARGQVGEAKELRVMVWMDSRDDQPGMAAIWDLTREAPSGKTAYGAVLPRPVLVIGRNIRTGAHFVLRYVPGEWMERLQAIGAEARRPAW
jgi:hypothetical protein